MITYIVMYIILYKIKEMYKFSQEMSCEDLSSPRSKEELSYL